MGLTDSDPGHHRGLAIVAIFEALKGAIVLLAGFAVLTFIHRDLQKVADQIVKHLHLNPASRFPRIFEQAAERTSDSQLWLLALGALAYSTMRFVEAYGLWTNRRWAEWFALLSSGFFLPVEIYELLRRFTEVKCGLFAVNVGIVLYLAYALRSSQRAAARILSAAAGNSKDNRTTVNTID